MGNNLQPPTAVEYSREKDFTDFVWAGAVNLLSLARWGILFVFIMTAIAVLDPPKKGKRQGVSSVPEDRVGEALDQLTGKITEAIDHLF